MSCTSPNTYYKRDPAKFGGVAGLTKDARRALSVDITVTVPCGQCIACRLAHAREWSLRVMHELKTSGRASFVTLTYDDVNLPKDRSLDYRHFQLFMHLLRKRLAGAGRFLMCGEYGELNGRAHYHAILFDCWFPDLVPFKVIDGNQLYTSAILTGLWKKGHCSVGEVTLDSAGYVARYSLKKIKGPSAGSAYQFLLEDGEIVDRVPPFLKSSNRPGIGYDWFVRYHMDAFPTDFLVYDSKRFPVPRYYAKLQERLDVGLYERVMKKRKRAMVARKDHVDNTAKRQITRTEHDLLVSQSKRDLK